MKNIRLVETKRTIHPASPLEVLWDMLCGCALIVLPWLGAVAIHFWVTH